MTNPKDILVTTTSSVDGLSIKQYLKPISAHIVAGTNLFSDFFASLSDVFGGRSQTYQKQLSSLYNEAINRLRIAAYEIGANCIVGLHVDMDEISGKGKSMFMLTAIGTAVVIDEPTTIKAVVDFNEKFENIDIDKINNLKQKREIIKKAVSDSLTLEDEIWDFITANQITEVYDFILKKLRLCITASSDIDNPLEKYFKRTISFLDALPEEIKVKLLYDSILNEENEKLATKLCGIVKELHLLDFNYITVLLQSNIFQKQKLGLRILSFDKQFYSKQDIKVITDLIAFIKTGFPERGTRSMKKQILSSKEKEIWICECKASTNEIERPCESCNKDIFGFKPNEVKPANIISVLEEKISLITALVK